MTTQNHAFGYFVVIGTSTDNFQIPNQYGLQAALGFILSGQNELPSQDLNENQREVTQYGIMSLERPAGDLTL